MKKNDCNVVIAGPGAGKTFDMIQKILEILPNLSPNRFCVVITYTNAATDEIQSRIESKITTPKNLFVGTTHSFLYRFLIQPYAHLLKLTTIDTNIIDAAKLPYSAKNYFAKKNGLINLAENLFEKGIITYDKVLEKSFEILNDKKIRRIVANRLQYIFIDEYQDTRLYQHQIVKNILEEKESTVFCIGDPHQSIFRFSYGSSQLKDEPKPEAYEETPLIDLKIKYGNYTIKTNYRSSHRIISFLNNFNIQFQQVPKKGSLCNKIPVYYLPQTNKKELLNSFNKLLETQNLEGYEGPFKTLHLSKEWKLFEEVKEDFKLNKLEKNTKVKSQFYEIYRIVLGLIGLKKTEVLRLTTEIEFRKFCFLTIKLLKTKKFEDEKHQENYIRKVFQNAFNVELPVENRGKMNIHNSIADVSSKKVFKKSRKFYSTIHSSKGLESQSVLVCARTQNELIKWLETDKNKLKTMDDDYRLGFVAFSRAKEMLCLSSLKPLNSKVRKRLEELNVKFYPNET